ncbi:MAG: hypothetical protein NZ930_02445 [Candidatus Bipolaricaulota bacterium]|nr:hypothetical protein [Candidatus Bipolaricaulota bacterium]MDW8030853.1 hypothetical protein [Candidatus Bipolaricaulota bacterium]
MFTKVTAVRTVVAVLALGVFGTFMAGTAQQLTTPADIASALAAYYKIGNRPTSITVAEIDQRIAYFPDFGEGTVEALKRAAPIETVSKLVSLKNSKGRALLSQKQLILLLTFYNLKP